MRIQATQIVAFEAEARATFVDEIIVHLTKFSRPLCQSLERERLKLVVVEGIARAEGYGFTKRGPIRLFLELILALGSGFDVDPQYPWAGETLRQRDFPNEMFKAGRLEHLANDFMSKVGGRHYREAEQALRSLPTLGDEGTRQLSQRSSQWDIRLALLSIFPSKLRHIGAAAVGDILRSAETLAREVYGEGSLRAVAALAILKLTLGMNCDVDMLFPWIGGTLRDPQITDPRVRATHLEQSAIVWLRSISASADMATIRTKGGFVS